jgi:diacylglycerol kinase family enzyme
VRGRTSRSRSGRLKRPSRPTRRLAAAAALILSAASLVLALVVAIQQFPHGLTVFAGVVAAGAAAWWGLLRNGAARMIGFSAAALLVAAALVALVLEGRVLEDLLIVAVLALAVAAARTAFAPHVRLPSAPRPERPVLFYNPASGGGKATRFRLVEEAQARHIETVELRRGDDLAELVRDAVAAGADALAMAGGDGSQAVVAAEAARSGLPYACIPAGTRNHFALDLGVDRDDVVGALDALVDGGERRVDLAEVNGRTFVNNVSLGVYAEAVRQAGYRDAKLRTLADTAPRVLGRGNGGHALRWTGSDGRERTSAAVLLISNDRYRLGRAVGSGTRPRLDAAALGITAFGSGGADGEFRKRVTEWSTPLFEVRSDAPVAAGIDGESAQLEPPLCFRTRPLALRVRVARHHPGASPSAAMPGRPSDVFRALARVALRGGDSAAAPGQGNGGDLGQRSPE